MRVDLLEETLERLEREGRRPKFIYTVPTFQNPAGVTMSLRAAQAPGRDRARARAARARGQPVRPAALRGRPAAAAVRARRRRLRDVPRAPSRRSSRPGIRLGWVVAPPPVLEKINLGKQAADLCTLDALAADGPGVLRAGPLAGLRRVAHRHLPQPPRHDARRAGRALPAAGRVDAARRRPVHLGDAARLHRHHRPAGAGAARERRVRPRRGRLPRRPRAQLDAAQLLRLGRGRHPRGHPPDRRGRDRAGRALRHAHRRARRAVPTASADADAAEPSAGARARARCPSRRPSASGGAGA